MQIFADYAPIPNIVQVSINILSLYAMPRDSSNDRSEIENSMVYAAAECVRDYICQIGRFASSPPLPTTPPSTQTQTIDTHQIAAVLNTLMQQGRS